MRKSALLFTICLAALAHSAIADEPPASTTPPPSNAIRGACRADIQKLCPGVQPGGGRIRDCMKQHEGELSDACKQALANRKPDHS